MLRLLLHGSCAEALTEPALQLAGPKLPGLPEQLGQEPMPEEQLVREPRPEGQGQPLELVLGLAGPPERPEQLGLAELQEYLPGALRGSSDALERTLYADAD